MYFTASFSSSLVQNEDEMVFAPYNYDAHKQIFILDLEFVSKVFKGLFSFLSVLIRRIVRLLPHLRRICIVGGIKIYVSLCYSECSDPASLLTRPHFSLADKLCNNQTVSLNDKIPKYVSLNSALNGMHCTALHCIILLGT